MTIDPYEVLGVDRDASANEIRVAFRHLARHLHPDTGGVDSAQMARVNDAWRTLSDPARRVAYDATVSGPAGRGAGATEDRSGDHGDGRLVLQPRLRLMMVTALVLVLVVFFAIVLIGFGRVGVTPHP